MNQDIEQYLRLFVNYRQDDWADWLYIAEFTINNRQQSATRYSPFFLNYGRHLRTSFTDGSEPISESAAQFSQQMKELHKAARLSLEQASHKMKQYYD